VLGWTVVEKEVAAKAALQGKSVRQYMENAHSHLSAQQPHSTYSFYTIDENHTQVRKKEVVLDTLRNDHSIPISLSFGLILLQKKLEQLSP
jgi:hypothetical protein